MSDMFWQLLLVSIAAPAVLWGLQELSKRGEWARQDAVAKAVRDAAAALVIKDADRAEAVDKIGQRLVSIEETGVETHKLVNSARTAEMQASLIGSQAALVVLMENVDLRRQLGNEPSAEVHGSIEALKTKVTELTAQIGERVKAER